ncbi:MULTISPECIES: hypothetical protein [unclassified Lysinibacillus]|uniref:hypothetical protein n=1 Tax=unclassified Lysinibacillus TaxID=2636778 RepID=UPI0028AD8B5D|nr:hypothetical protein [Lysinibacillus sp.]
MYSILSRNYSKPGEVINLESEPLKGRVNPLQKSCKVIIMCEEPLQTAVEAIILEGEPLQKGSEVIIVCEEPLIGRVNPLQK